MNRDRFWINYLWIWYATCLLVGLLLLMMGIHEGQGITLLAAAVELFFAGRFYRYYKWLKRQSGDTKR